MAYNKSSGLKFKTETYNGRTTTKGTMWFKPCRNGDWKYTVVKGNKTLTIIIPSNLRSVQTAKGERLPISVLAGSAASSETFDIF